jgi:hypothetical protein
MERPNLLYIKTLSGGDLEFEKKLIDVIKKEFPLEKNKYENLVLFRDFKETAEIVHKLKHKISILGLEKSYRIAIKFEENLLNENLALKEQFESVLKNMSNFINQLE